MIWEPEHKIEKCLRSLPAGQIRVVAAARWCRDVCGKSKASLLRWLSVIGVELVVPDDA
jgi:hypothetical protein